jgi:two-component system sensor histidine kinase TtrS
MASGIAHELNQPLTVINNYSRACMRMLSSNEPMTDQCSEVMEKISIQAERAGDVIKQIRHFVKKDLPEKKPVAVSEMIDMVLELTRMEVERKHVNLEVKLDESVIYVLAQDTQIEQVMINLVRNAIEAMDQMPIEKRNLLIQTLAVTDNKLKISISDSGSGIKEELLDQLFNPFITSKEQGIGLGLSISQGIIEAHDDQIIIEDNSENGAIFSFKLPVVVAPELNLNSEKILQKELV